MSDHLPVLKVRLFGGFSASYGEIPVSFGRNTTTKAMKLLQILLYHGDTGISRDKLFVILSKDVQACTDKVKKLTLLKKICLMYRGEFLPELSGDEWVLVESVQYKNIYSESLQELCKLLIERGDYEEALRFCEPACQLYPFDEWQSVRIDCYMALNRYKDAVQEYENTAKLFFEELGIRPSALTTNHRNSATSRNV